jgi:flagellar biosynthesis/type III secretory pathway M-ring protein FliF/YscJ
MGNVRNTVFAAATMLPLVVAAPALAGPCSDQIAAVSRALSGYPNVSGSPTTGTLNGAGASNKSNAPAPNNAAQAKDTTASGGSLTGESANREMNAAASNTATSPEDVRRQQAGVPTMADDPNAKTPNQRVAQATQQLDLARALDAKNDPACHQAANQANQLVKPD